MQQLRKIGAIGGAVVLTLCWPLAVGQIGQTVITDGIQHLNSASVAAKVIDYDRGYLSSDVKTQYTIIDPALKQQLEIDGLPTQFVVNSHVSHGLFSLTALSTFEKTNPIPLTLTTTTQLNGNTEFDFALASWNFTSDAKHGATFSSSPAHLTGSATVLGHVDYQLSMPSVQLNFANGDSASLTELTAMGTGKLEQGYWLGEQNMQAKHVNINDASGTTLFDLQQSEYAVNSTHDVKQDTITSTMRFHANALTTSDGAVSDLKFDFSLNNLDKKAFDHLFNLYHSDHSLEHGDLQAMLPDIDVLFNKGFSFSLNDLSLKVGKGNFKTDLHLAIPTGTANVSKDPSQILGALTGDFDTVFSRQLVVDYPFIKQGVDELMVMEMMQETDSGYEMKGKVDSGNIVFASGHKVPMLSLLMPLLM